MNTGRKMNHNQPSVMIQGEVKHGTAPLCQLIDMNERRKVLFKGWAESEKAKKKLEDAFKSLEESRKEKEVWMERHRIAEKMKEAAEKKARDLQAQHYDRSKNIKVTDDDFSTIIAKLGKFSGKLSNFPPNSKSCFKKDLPREQLIQFFIKNIDNKAEIEFLFDQDKDRIDYALVSVLVEKLITAEIVKHIYRAEIHLDSKINDAFKEIRELLESTGHERWISDFRLKISKATYDLIHRYDKDNKARDINNAKREFVISGIVTKLSVIYNKPEDIRLRIEKLVDMAIELSLPIRGQEDLVEIVDLEVGNEVYKNQVKPMYRQFDSPTIVLGVSPVFLAKSTKDDENQSVNEEEEGDITRTYLKDHTLVYPGKAIY
ncbi:hypothetical protein MFLAVUS_005267 [Mucor flavus]|uniref:Uncharacterized protein n=1 Tax=Mucor flavus TaxID=439312 RepID=A0ABP9YY97_9FUNG